MLQFAELLRSIERPRFLLRWVGTGASSVSFPLCSSVEEISFVPADLGSVIFASGFAVVVAAGVMASALDGFPFTASVETVGVAADGVFSEAPAISDAHCFLRRAIDGLSILGASVLEQVDLSTARLRV